MVANRINGKEIAEKIREEIAIKVRNLKNNHQVIPGLAVILVGNDPASAVYVRSKEKAAIELGMKSEAIIMPEETTQDELINQIRLINDDESFHGVLVQLPLPNHLDENVVIESIDPLKDVDGLHPENMGMLMAGRPRFVSATPAGIQQILIRTGNDPGGKNVVVCGRSNIVGKPIANLLMQRASGANATVTVCHTRTANLSEITKKADILIAAIGSPHAISSEMVKEGVVVIDVGINRIDAPERPRGYRLVGDVDYKAVREKASAITPVPGGVGPMTIAMLLNNALLAADLSIQSRV
ncbi:MAG: bifunctional 5,10-methylenetetrahydrofolate dehydrogenase/5,10-methenyltetrahydrofolate cyclohydrolase [Dehalococcoidia bacterium]